MQQAGAQPGGSDIQQVARQKTATMVAIYCENKDKRKLARRLRGGL